MYSGYRSKSKLPIKSSELRRFWDWISELWWHYFCLAALDFPGLYFALPLPKLYLSSCFILFPASRRSALSYPSRYSLFPTIFLCRVIPLDLYPVWISFWKLIFGRKSDVLAMCYSIMMDCRCWGARALGCWLLGDVLVMCDCTRS